MKKIRQGKRDLKSTIIFLLALVIFIYAIVRLGMIFWEYAKGQNTYDKLNKFTSSTDVGKGGELPENFSVDFEALKKINPDIVGWIRFENMEIKCGSIFMEAENASDFSDDNTFIYGHNMKDKSMFAKLNQFKDEQIYKENPEFLIYTEDAIYRYSIFSCYVADISWDSFNYQFATEDAYGEWLQTVKNRSIYDTGVTPQKDQKTVTLMTCTPSGENYRFLVHGALAEVIQPKEK